MFDSPVFLIGSAVATLWGGIYYALRGRKLSELFLYWVAALAGFFIGHFLADILGFSMLQFGNLHIIEGSIGSWLLMAVVRWLGV